MIEHMDTASPLSWDEWRDLQPGRRYEGSTVPDRFRSTSTPVPGQSSVPPEFTSTSTPATPAAESTRFGTDYR